VILKRLNIKPVQHIIEEMIQIMLVVGVVVLWFVSFSSFFGVSPLDIKIKEVFIILVHVHLI
jgi:hypothetical protein